MISKTSAELIESCMTNDLKKLEKLLKSEKVEFDGSDTVKFYLHVSKIVTGAHKKSKGEWNMTMEPADWIKKRDATAYDFYDEKSHQVLMTLAIEEQENKVWIEVLRG